MPRGAPKTPNRASRRKSKQRTPTRRSPTPAPQNTNSDIILEGGTAENRAAGGESTAPFLPNTNVAKINLKAKSPTVKELPAQLATTQGTLADILTAIYM